MTKRTRWIVIGAIAAAVIVGGGGTAWALLAEETVTSAEADRARSAAETAVPGGKAGEVEREDDDGAKYEVEVTKADGAKVEVLLTADLKLIRVDADDD